MSYRFTACDTSPAPAPVNAHPHAALERTTPREQALSPPSVKNPIQIKGLSGRDPKQNRLLAALPAADYGHLLAALELVTMPLGMVVCEPGSDMQHVYFPTSCIVSLFHQTKNGASAETAVVGNEGLVGVTLFMGGGSVLTRAIVNSAGYGFRLRKNILDEEFGRGGALQQLLLRYTQALITQMSQTVVCNRHHSVIQQLCRWLLFNLDRLPSNELCVTQETIAGMLGVRRESVGAAAGRLQDDGLIHYSRGHINVLDRPGLEARACECYAGVKQEYDRLLHN